MSADYTWRPVQPPPPPAGVIDIGLICAIGRRFFHGGTADEMIDGIELSTDSLDWLAGIRDAAPNNDTGGSAIDLIDAIERYGTVRITVQR